MKTLRTALTGVALCLLAGGYAASQWAFLTRHAAEYATSVDVPVVKSISLVLVLAAAILAFFPDRSPEAETRC